MWSTPFIVSSYYFLSSPLVFPLLLAQYISACFAGCVQLLVTSPSSLCNALINSVPGMQLTVQLLPGPPLCHCLPFSSPLSSTHTHHEAVLKGSRAPHSSWLLSVLPWCIFHSLDRRAGFLRLAEHLTALRAWCKQCLSGW